MALFITARSYGNRRKGHDCVTLDLETSLTDIPINVKHRQDPFTLRVFKVTLSDLPGSRGEEKTDEMGRKDNLHVLKGPGPYVVYVKLDEVVVSNSRKTHGPRRRHLEVGPTCNLSRRNETFEDYGPKVGSGHLGLRNPRPDLYP